MRFRWMLFKNAFTDSYNRITSPYAAGFCLVVVRKHSNAYTLKKNNSISNHTIPMTFNLFLWIFFFVFIYSSFRIPYSNQIKSKLRYQFWIHGSLMHEIKIQMMSLGRMRFVDNHTHTHTHIKWLNVVKSEMRKTVKHSKHITLLIRAYWIWPRDCWTVCFFFSFLEPKFLLVWPRHGIYKKMLLKCVLKSRRMFAFGKIIIWKRDGNENTREPESEPEPDKWKTLCVFKSCANIPYIWYIGFNMVGSS